MKRKIFISINLPDRTKRELTKAVREWEDLPVKWTKEENLHIGLLFLGFVDEELIIEIGSKVEEVTKDTETFYVDFSRIELGPDPENPRSVWLRGEPSLEMKKILEDIEKKLGMHSSARKQFVPHIILGRIRKEKWEALKEKPRIEKNFPLPIDIESVDVMASEFEGETEYVIVQQCFLK